MNGYSEPSNNTHNHTHAQPRFLAISATGTYRLATFCKNLQALLCPPDNDRLPKAFPTRTSCKWAAKAVLANRSDSSILESSLRPLPLVFGFSLAVVEPFPVTLQEA